MKSKRIMLSIMIAAITVLSYSANAQQDTTRRKVNPVKTQKEVENRKDTMVLQKNDNMQHNMKSDHIMMQNGKMVMMKDGKTMPVNKEITLKNGTVIMTNGQYKGKDGNIMMMKEGDMMDMDGKMMTPKKYPPK